MRPIQQIEAELFSLPVEVRLQLIQRLAASLLSSDITSSVEDGWENQDVSIVQEQGVWVAQVEAGGDLTTAISNLRQQRHQQFF